MQHRGIKWFDHILRMNPDTPVQKAFKEALTDLKGKVGRPPEIELKNIKEDPKPLTKKEEKKDGVADKNSWKILTKNIMMLRQ